jgi:hypothetical protein
VPAESIENNNSRKLLGVTMKRADDLRCQDSYWNTTQDELKAARRRGDTGVLAGAVILLALLFFNREHASETAWWVIGSAALLAIIVPSTWYVAKRRRRIAMARGLECASCSYVPHDTEITAVAESRCCLRCGESLQR